MGAGNPYAPPAKYVTKISASPQAEYSRGKGSYKNPNFKPMAPNYGGKGGAGVLEGRAQLAPNQSYIGGRNDDGLIRTSTLNPEWVKWNAAQQQQKDAAANAAAAQTVPNAQAYRSRALNNIRGSGAEAGRGRTTISTTPQGLFDSVRGGRKTLLGQ